MLLKVPSNPWSTSFQMTEAYISPILLALLVSDVETLLYGMHIILFILCTRILNRRWQKAKRKSQIILLVALCTMFVLSTADVAVSWHLVLAHPEYMYATSGETFLKAIYPKFWFHLFNNSIADVLLLTRCYVVWSRNKTILFTGGLVLLLGTTFGFISEASTSPSLKKFIAVYILIILVLNVGLTLLTAGRIWWVARNARNVLGREVATRYRIAMIIVIESGCLYTLSKILLLSFSSTTLVLMAATITIRVVTIMPTLIIVQIALGQTATKISSVTPEPEPVEEARERRRSNSVVLDTIINTNVHFTNGTRYTGGTSQRETQGTRTGGTQELSSVEAGY